MTAPKAMLPFAPAAIVVEVDGVKHTGWYTVGARMITVSSADGASVSTSTTGPPENVARLLLLTLIRKRQERQRSAGRAEIDRSLSK